MKNYCNPIQKCVLFAATWFFISACEREHLQPDIPEGTAQPLFYISAMLDTHAVYYASGVNSYIGQASVIDSLTWRWFDFYLYSQLSSPLQPVSCFRIYICNARFDLGDPEQDLDSTIFADTLYYQDYVWGFTPFAVTVEWFDSTGVKYSSGLLPQPPGFDSFVITSVEDISFGNKNYKKVTAEFSCLLMEGNSFNIIPVTDGRATIIFGVD